MKYKHIKFNNGLQGIDWALEQVTSDWMLVSIVPYTAYETIAVFQKAAPRQSKTSKEEK